MPNGTVDEIELIEDSEPEHSLIMAYWAPTTSESRFPRAIASESEPQASHFDAPSPVDPRSAPSPAGPSRPALRASPVMIERNSPPAPSASSSRVIPLSQNNGSASSSDSINMDSRSHHNHTDDVRTSPGGTKRRLAPTDTRQASKRSARSLVHLSSVSAVLREEHKSGPWGPETGKKLPRRIANREGPTQYYPAADQSSTSDTFEAMSFVKADRESSTVSEVQMEPKLNRSAFDPAVDGPPASPGQRSNASFDVDVTQSAQAKAELAEETLDDELEDLPAVERLRGGLLKFRYQAKSAAVSSQPSSHCKPREGQIKPSASTGVRAIDSKGKRIAAPFVASEVTFDIPADERIRHLDICPFCSVKWTANKTVMAKAAHLRQCAVSNDLTSQTLRVLVENRLLTLARERAETRATQQRARTIFDHAVGVGEGASVFREVTVIGIEDNITTDGVSAVDAWQHDLNKSKRRPHLDKLAKVAHEIRKERRETAIRDSRDSTPATSALQQPQATGLLAPSSTGTRRATAERAHAVLDAFGGTGLTQQARNMSDQTSSSARTPEVRSRNSLKGKQRVKNEDETHTGDSSIEFVLPSTQEFPTSRVAQSLAREGKGAFIARPAKLVTASDSPSADETASSSYHGSLWLAASGKDGHAVNRVVSTSRASPDPPTTSRTDNVSSCDDRGAHSTGLTSRQTTLSPTIASTIQSMRTLGFPSPSRNSPLAPDDCDEVCLTDRDNSGESGILTWEGGASAGVKQRIEVEDDVIIAADNTRVCEDDPGDGSVTSEDEPLIRKVGRRRRRSFTMEPLALISDDDLRVAHSPELTSPSERGLHTAATEDKPDYASWQLEDLKKEVARFGFRRSSKREVLLRRLDEVWSAMRTSGTALEGPTMSQEPKKAPTSRKRKPRTAQGGDDITEADFIGQETVGERLRLLLLRNEDLYLRILRYEPIYFEEIVALSAENGLKASKPLLLRCLDEQCITYFTQDPTNGSRRRRK